jgi:hypothetical protein
MLGLVVITGRTEEDLSGIPMNLLLLLLLLLQQNQKVCWRFMTCVVEPGKMLSIVF